MSVPAVNLRIEKGTDFEATFNVSGDDGSPTLLNNFVGAAKIRKHPTAPTSHSFSVSITAATGEVTIGMGKTVTAQLTSGRNYYDVLLTSQTNDTSFKVAEGMIIVSDTVSL